MCVFLMHLYNKLSLPCETSCILVHLSQSSSHASSSVHYAGDGSQRLLTPPQSLLSPQVSRYGGADHIRWAANEEASGGQQSGVYHLVIRRAWEWWRRTE